MKVCTDSCILGAWFAKKLSQYETILDIGTGTGILMLMLAQKKKANIHGIELDSSCFKQLKENIEQSVWKERLAAYNGDVRSHSFASKFDFIITNPPFFENDLPSLTNNENVAKHSHELTLKELIEVIDRNLSNDGAFGILLPFDRWKYFNGLSEQWHFHLCEKFFIKHSPAHNFSRAILQFSRHKKNDVPTFEMSIRKEEAAGYTDEFINLLKDYYLYL